LEKGLLYPMPVVYLQRLLKELQRRYPTFGRHWLATGQELTTEIARYLGIMPEEVRISDPALGQRGAIMLDRTLLPPEERKEVLGQARVLLPVAPYAGPLQPVCFRKAEFQVSQQQVFSAVDLAGLLRSLYDLDKLETPEWYSPSLLDGCTAWRQRGFYIAPEFERDDYLRVFNRFLDAGVLISPEPQVPSVLPGAATQGELSLLLSLFREEV
jgi:hypothetical protein